MTKKRLAVLGGVALIVVLVASLAGVAYVFADEPTPTPAPKTYGWGRGFGFGGGICGQAELEAAAKALGMTADELSTQLWGGRTLADLADKAGVDLQTVRDAVEAANQAAIKDAINQAVKDGYLTQEQADWLLQGLEKGWLGGGFGHGFGFGRGMMGGFGRGIRMRGGFGSFAPPSAPSVAPSSSSL
jgi:uncharacterized membrane protein